MMCGCNVREGQDASHLHAADVYGENGGEEKHLQEEVGHQADDSKQTELLKTQKEELTSQTGACKGKRTLPV